MKRVLVIILAAAFVVGVVGALPAAEITWKGNVRTMALAYDNLRDITAAAAADDNGQLFSTRLRLMPTISMEDGAVNFIGAIEMGDLIWGTAQPVVGTGGGDRVAWEVKNAYMSFKLPTEATNATLEAGLGPFWTAKGFINGLDVAFIRAFIFQGPWLILPGYAIAVDDVSTATGIGGSSDMTVGFLGVWYLSPIAAGPAEITSAYCFVEPVWEKTGTFSTDLTWYWISPGLTLKSGPIDVAADFGYLTGTDTANDFDFASYGADIALTFAPEDAPFAVKGRLAYASGDKDGWYTPGTEKKVTQFFGAAANCNYTLLWGGKWHEDRYADDNGNLETPMVPASHSGLATNGLLLVGGNVEYTLTEVTSVDVGGAIIRSGDIRATGTTAKDVGTEVDVVLTRKIYDSLTVNLLGGYMAPGEYGHANADAPWMLGARLEYSFE